MTTESTKSEEQQSAEFSTEELSPEQLADEIVQQAEEQVEEQHEQAHEVISAEQERINELELALAAAQAKVTDQKDSVIRAKAEVDNIRRRSAQDVDKAKKFALEKFAGEMLVTVDNLERALQNIDKEDDSKAAVIEGVELTLQGLISSLEKFGIKSVDPQDQPFNPELHQAMSMQEVPGVAPNTVIAVMQKGYELNGRLIRPAMVMVSKAAPSVDESV
ncbi:nucleotide exchange factor GrpE [Colwellia sp. 4_MG-2023]|jgi:molecular chaperone GrpE|uniref:nucleotide exchange factor GrpE n=1 Tax=unclassified Colwellia TaxID=196834 RepID=UPI001C08DA45|nr:MULTISPECIES: nucleotide exchange factor GrpE [unclassified Colwellia]MBU2925617.1 nucleotide exchange factor GrpE [Colwellia sp. C2M11]MDO6489340.1 nucleotide exchange factor GrpE [Colwellia sp. 6_MG-2023]MDO6507535.1 nucleotide exchange factor GrpE [Colwellia sp. 5_MG-2023]MDO6556207.1 nucleotide exchange factor GrpE [Colwellia sp. 4_MG-2023]MDO6651157.1 nucleotide exchange factor GrpE [Colwellia sp. 3_MG-2023]